MAQSPDAQKHAKHSTAKTIVKNDDIDTATHFSGVSYHSIHFLNEKPCMIYLFNLILPIRWVHQPPNYF